MRSALEINQLSCRYHVSHQQTELVLNQLNLSVHQGEICAIIGASGCGKSTLLRVIAGLIPSEQGQIRLQGQPLNDGAYQCPAEQRQIGMIFQDYALFPHLTVAQNIRFGIREKGRSAAIVDEMLALVNLQGFAKRYPHELSGGQQQRVAIARALAHEPKLLLLDEPFSNIDVQIRQQLMLDIRQILKRKQITALFVTHSQEEAFLFADQLALLKKGQVLQQGDGEALYHFPQHPYVANFFGQANYLPIVEQTPEYYRTALGQMNRNQGLLAQEQQPQEQFQEQSQEQLYLMIRPQHLELFAMAPSMTERKSQAENEFATQTPIIGQIIEKRFLGGQSWYKVRYQQQDYQVTSGDYQFALGERVRLAVRPHTQVLFTQTQLMQTE